MEFCVVDRGDGNYYIYERGGGSSVGVMAFLIIWAIISDLVASIGLPVAAYFLFIKNAPNLLIGISQSIPILITAAVVWFINICLFSKFVLKKDVFKKLTVSLVSINRFIRYVLILTIFIVLICNLIPAVKHIESDMVFGAAFAYNFLISIIELALLLKEDLVGKKALLSILIAFVSGCVVGAVCMEIEAAKKVLFEIVVLTILVVLEIGIIISRKKHI
ncbi:MAG: hypothetical protein K2O41_02730 [Clostridia bacterium]|nr:hypothetical protein [Clostridia bacterium]